ncbi:hypothetical protein Tsubulata_026849 [Turnera subulata]|uniref:Leucine-rich repeat-containing N-terminal plant-type domain-containing protein n=1 Tax=Turnera subulata TaxID=218843 RepID=A0A9Q0G949_9ROSI|nr:hypothetical protein Tsubulata_026849 [Turnera subulata]
MSYNTLTGGIPTTLGNIRVLGTLDLSHNSLSGEIPPSLVELFFLSALELSNNNLTGPILARYQFATFEVEALQTTLDCTGYRLRYHAPNHH